MNTNTKHTVEGEGGFHGAVAGALQPKGDILVLHTWLSQRMDGVGR